MMDQEPQYIETFREEAREHLNIIENALLDMEQKPDGQEAINRLFRAIHTIKGSGAMFGFDDLADFAHHAETLLDQVREGIVPVNSELINLILLVKDQINVMLDAGKDGNHVDPNVSGMIVERLRGLYAKPEENSIPFSTAENQGEDAADQDKEITYRIRFRPNPEIMASGMDPALILGDLHAFGPCEMTAYTENVPLLESLEPDRIFFCWDILLTTAAGMDAVKDVFLFVEEGSEISIHKLRNDSSSEDDSRPRLGEILVDRGDINEKMIRV